MNINDLNKKINDIKPKNSLGFNKIEEKSSAIDDWCASKNFSAYKDYTMNSYYNKINGALRAGFTSDFYVPNDIEKLDKIFKTMPKEMLPEEDMVVYRGALFTNELMDIISGKSTDDIYIEKGFVSTSKDKQIAKNFVYMDKDSNVLMRITIPKGSKVIDDEKLPSYARSKMFSEREVLIPRNAQFKITGYNPKTKTIEATYIGQKQPLTMPETIKVSGSDILSNINKAMINKEFNIKKSNI